MRWHLNTGNERLENFVFDNIDQSREVITLRHRNGWVWGGGECKMKIRSSCSKNKNFEVVIAKH